MFNSAEDFYSQRDDRTNRCVDINNYQKVKCLVISNSEIANSYSGQVMILTSINIMSRWCRNIDIAVPNSPLHERLLLINNTLHSRIKTEINNADPFGNFNFVTNPKKQYDFILQIGDDNCGLTKVDFSIDGDGWLAVVEQGSLSFGLNHKNLNPVGPAMAACIGVTQIFKSAVGQPKEALLENLYISAFDLTIYKGMPSNTNLEIPEIIDIGNAQIVGIGSVGSAFLYFLKMLMVKGVFTLIDHDIIKLPNLNRSPIFGVSNCSEFKALVGSQYLNGKGITAIPFRGTYADYISTHGRKKNEVDILFPLANEYNVRWAIENNYPPLMIYGTTTMDWGINLGRHIPFIDDCLVCRYPEKKEDIQYVCSEGKLYAPKQEVVDAALPFLSPLAAILIVAEVIKTQLKGYPFNEDFVFLDFKGKTEKILKYQRKPKRNCFCRNKNEDIFWCYNEFTKYAFLSKKKKCFA